MTTVKVLDFSAQLHLDQKRYSRYVCDSRAIPNMIDGLKPVQRRILWTMWNTNAKNQFTKTVKVAGMVMGYHPHGDASIQDAIAQMTQDFTFANNYPLISGEGTFGDVLDPKAIASPRYTEVKLSHFAQQIGIFESLADIDYIDNYDETDREPVFFVPKIPLVLLNPTMGIATGFRCNILARNLAEVITEMVKVLKQQLQQTPQKSGELKPWYKNFAGKTQTTRNEKGQVVFSTHFGFKKIGNTFYLIAAPQSWNREKTIQYLEVLIKEDNDLKDYIDHSKESFLIELILKRGNEITAKKLQNLFSRHNNETEMLNVIDAKGRLQNLTAHQIIQLFCDYRQQHLIKRFIRLAKLEAEKIAKQKELIRFIQEGWNVTVLQMKNRKEFMEALRSNEFVYYEWLVDLPVYRLTKAEIQKCQKIIAESKKLLANYHKLSTNHKFLLNFIIAEIEKLKTQLSVPKR